MNPEEALLKLIRLDAHIDSLRMERAQLERIISKLEREREIFVREHSSLFRPDEPAGEHQK
jgi:hypothetical protein